MSDELVYGIHAVAAVLARRPSAVRSLMIQSGRADRRVQALVEAARDARITVEPRAATELDAMLPGLVHQGVVAKVEPAKAVDENAFLASLDVANKPPLILVLDGVQDPHNLGACLRTADGVGADALVVPRDRATGLTPVVRKVAAGAAETVPLVQVTNLARFLRELKEEGVWVVGTDGDGDKLHYEVDLKGPLAIVLGAEGTGMRRLTREVCDHVVRLPMRGAVQSLNVSVATGVLLYEALRQRGAT